MNTIEPTQPRYTIDHQGSALTITIPARKNPIVVVFMTIWLCIWGGMGLFMLIPFGGFAILPLLLGLTEETEALAALPFACFAGLGGLFALLVWGGGFSIVGYFLLWQFVGKEIITVDSWAINVQRKLFRFGRIKSYKAEHIQNMRVEIYTRRGRRSTYTYWPLTFDYGTSTIRIAKEATEVENKQILETIQEQFSQYRH